MLNNPLRKSILYLGILFLEKLLEELELLVPAEVDLHGEHFLL